MGEQTLFSHYLQEALMFSFGVSFGVCPASTKALAQCSGVSCHLEQASIAFVFKNGNPPRSRWFVVGGQ